MSSHPSLLNNRAQKALVDWFLAHQRDLPWRRDKDPYKIWISETMLQQTTSTAVKPYFEKFIKTFPTLEDLAAAKIEDVYELWAGLGYYSRARNILKAAQLLAAQKKFPQTFEELIGFPGLGPYTARAVASLAFGQRVGVLDGNVIRVLSRIGNQKVEWWKGPGRQKLQTQADALVEEQNPYWMNQGLMELGATICLPKNPSCVICPAQPYCKAFKAQTTHELPLKKPKKVSEIWAWEPRVYSHKGQLAFVKDASLPFLKNHWVLPGQARRLDSKPLTFDFKHNITHHEIYVTLSSKPRKMTAPKEKEILWLSIEEIQRQIPTSLIKKTLAHWRK